MSDEFFVCVAIVAALGLGLLLGRMIHKHLFRERDGILKARRDHRNTCRACATAYWRACELLKDGEKMPFAEWVRSPDGCAEWRALQ